MIRRIPEEAHDLFDYTSGRWIYNDALRRSERRRCFDISELKRLAAASIHQRTEDVAKFEKLAEGGFNRAFLVTMRDGFQLVARIPYPSTAPKDLLVASEVATMDFLRSHGIPVPRVYGYSTVSTNPADTEYIFMELIRGRNLGDIWFDLSERQRITVVSKIVELEARIFALRFPASGSLYHCGDLQGETARTAVPTADHLSGENNFCIGPDTALGLWFGKRLAFPVERGPYKDCLAALTAGAEKEISYLTKYGRPILPFQRLRREIYDYKPRSHLDHLVNLRQYLQIAPHLIPHHDPALARPVMRHSDLQPSNIFVTDKLEITGLIDWQHCAILPLFLHSAIPNSFQNYGDEISESMQLPTLPANYDELDEMKQFAEVELLRKRQLHYFYLRETAKINPEHFNALMNGLNTLRRKLFHHASEPWDGDNVTLKADLVSLTAKWQQLTSSSGSEVPCPITFSDHEAAACVQLDSAQVEADEQLQACREAIGVGTEGWVPLALYEEVKQREVKLKANALDAAETEEERAMTREH
ncbi:phosphotransferase [Trichophyton tonsurans CBS 112818]|uniref:Phosphotransferase n=1 Tax=Trichophyton tonsurans (strain CBS 112818) TaxID=647933 RepID=F2S2C7_TRIT1|nr:phosphotransferase [Trichophyton tonsurans CBS 112818]